MAVPLVNLDGLEVDVLDLLEVVFAYSTVEGETLSPVVLGLVLLVLRLRVALVRVNSHSKEKLLAVTLTTGQDQVLGEGGLQLVNVLERSKVSLSKYSLQFLHLMGFFLFSYAIGTFI